MANPASVPPFMDSKRDNIKRKRAISTTLEQYNIFLHAMETDEIFRKGINLNYIEKKWKDIAEKLNTASTAGLELSIPEWRKRFKDWKNALRSKQRKIVAQEENPESVVVNPNLKLTDLEKRGLNLFGQYKSYTVPSAPFVTPDFVQCSPKFEPQIEINVQNGGSLQFEQEMLGDNNQQYYGNSNNYCDSLNSNFNDEDHMRQDDEDSDDENSKEKRRESPSHFTKSDVPQFSSLLRNALKVAKVNPQKKLCNCTNDAFKESIITLAKVEELKLKFEIAKYKHKHPDFVFDYN